jgi:hypothetical protein
MAPALLLTPLGIQAARITMMKNKAIHSLLPALIAAAALFTFACAGGEDDIAGKDREAPSEVAQAPAEAVTPHLNELNDSPRSVDVQEDAAGAELEARERELAARQADLEERERRLQEGEGETRAEVRPEAPRPAAPRREERAAVEESRIEITPARRPEPAVEEVEVREEPARAEADEAEAPREAEPEPEPRPEAERLPALITTATIPSGTTMDVEFLEAVASNTHREGDTFRVRVASDVREEGHVVIPAGSEIVGMVTESAPVQKKIGGRARLAVAFTDLVLPSGTRVPIDASFVQQGRNETGRDAATIGGAAAGGAILGRVLNKGDRSKGGTIGAIIGAAAGAVIASRTPAEDVMIPRGTVVSLRLDDPVEIRVAASKRRWD